MNITLFNKNEYLVNNNALYRKHTEHLSTTEPLYIDGMSGSDNIVHEPEDVMVLHYTIPEGGEHALLWSNPAGIKSVHIPGLADIVVNGDVQMGGYYYDFPGPGEYVIEIKLLNDSIPGGTFNVSPVASIEIPHGVKVITRGSFSSNSTLKHLVIPGSVTEIQDTAFQNCTNLETVVIENAATSIGNNCFAGCYSLKSIDLGNAITRIEYSAFGGCTSLESLTIPESATIITPPCGGCNNLKTVVINGKIETQGVLSGLPNVETIVFGNGVTRILAGFVNCDTVKSVTIGKNVTQIDSGAFYNLPFVNLSEITYKSTVEDFKKVVLQNGWNTNGIGTNIVHCTDGDYAIPFCVKLIMNDGNVIYNLNGPGDAASGLSTYFGPNYSYDSVVGVEFGEKCTGVGHSAFSGFRNLETVKFSNTITGISSYAFENCYKLHSVTIPESVTSLANNAFYNCYITDMIINSNAIASNDINYSTSALKRIVFGEKVTAIGSNKCLSAYNLSSVTFLGRVTSINASAFYLCYDLENIVLPDSLTAIGNSAFYYCKNLQNVNIPEGVLTIGHNAFYSCTNFTTITIPESVTSIGNNAFNSCSNVKEFYYYSTSPLVLQSIFYNTGDWDLEKLVIGDKTPSIDGLLGIYTLKTVTLGKSITSIKHDLFSGCSELKSVDIRGNITSIENNAFYNCYSLENIEIQNTVTSIGGNAFYNCKALKTVVVPDSVTSIGGGAFNGCDSFEKIEIPNSVVEIGTYVFTSCKKLSSAAIYSNSIPSGMFSYCGSLEDVNISNNVTNIETAAFMECKFLKEITIPESVTTIGQSIFKNCTRLQKITFLSKTPIVTGGNASNLLYGIQSSCKIYVPAESVDTYKQEWATYASRILPIEEE